MKPGSPPLQSIRLLDQVRERIRYLHYSLKALPGIIKFNSNFRTTNAG